MTSLGITNREHCGEGSLGGSQGIFSPLGSGLGRGTPTWKWEHGAHGVLRFFQARESQTTDG